MIRLDVQLELNYTVFDPIGADFVFNLHAARTAHQCVTDERLVLSQDITPDLGTDPGTGTRFLRLHAAQGPLRVVYSAIVTIDHHRADPGTLLETPVRSLPLEVMPYLHPSRYCQSDRLMRLALSQFGSLPLGYDRVAAIQRWVQQRITFASNSSNSSTSAVDTLIDQAGVCRDFTHLMIALCRAVNIPARIATGTDYGADPALGPPDFHAYVEAFLGDRWYIFDAAGTGIPMGFMRLGTGRDAADVAFATIFGGVSSQAPIVHVTALEGEGFELPHHCREALSTLPAVPMGQAAAPSAQAPAQPAIDELA